MKFTTKLTTGIAAASAAALGVGLLAFAPGVGAAFTDSATANANIKIGTFSCAIDDTNLPSGVTLSSNKRIATVDLGVLQSSAAGTKSATLTLKNTGSIGILTSWTATPSGGLFGTSASGAMHALPAPPSAVLASNGDTQAFTVGFSWGELQQSDLGKSGSVTYTASCNEVPPRTYHNYVENGGSVNFETNGDFQLNTPNGASSAAGVVTNALYAGETLPETEPTFKLASGVVDDDNPFLGVLVQKGSTQGWIRAYATPSYTALNWQVLGTGLPVSGNGNSWSTLRQTLTDEGWTVVQAALITNGSHNLSVTVTSLCFGTMHLGSEACGW